MTHACASGDLKVAHIVASVAEEASGPSYSVPALCDGLKREGCTVSLLTIGPPSIGTVRNVPHRTYEQDFGSVPMLSQLRISRALKAACRRAAADGAILHSHGLWLMSNVYPALAASAHGIPSVLSPRGMLGAEALRFSQVKKTLMWAAFQKHSLQLVNCFHATSEAEWQDIRTFGLRQPVCVIPNGIDVPERVQRSVTEERRVLLYLGRLHPKKGIDRLLKAWADVQEDFADWDVVIAGTSELDYEAKLKAMVMDLGLARVFFPGPRYGADKVDSYKSADIFVMPTLNENFGLTVAEALSLELPVLCTKGAPWAGLETERCGWWVDGDVPALAAALRSAMRTPKDELQTMGERGRAWMIRDFSWDNVAREMIAVYAWLLGRSERPASVHLD